jgi:preprotein translocase subunit Sec63
MGNMDEYYRVLDLEPNESPENVKQAYRDLAFIWHPDRINNNSRLKHKAESKFKQINEAYHRLRFYQALLEAQALDTSKNIAKSNIPTPAIPMPRYVNVAYPPDSYVWLY